MPDILKKTRMSEQAPEDRIKNFEEVAFGYTKEQAIEEAKRCLQCKNRPCVLGCPVSVPIPEFIQEVINENFDKAYDIILKENRLPAICGRVCPQETQCELKCVRRIKGEAVAIGRLERFVADYVLSKKNEINKVNINEENKIAVIGSGPAGLTCAGELANKGYSVTIFEAFHKLGGVLVYGIPEFRLPKTLVENEIDKIIELGVNIEKNVVIGKTLTIDDLFEDGYKAVFIGSGAGLPTFLNIKGENLNGVFSANEFLTRSNLMKAYAFPAKPTPIKVGNTVVVIGGGNVAMDAARTAKRLGAESIVVYRRSLKEMPARDEEIHHAREEGVVFQFLTNPVRIIGDENGQVIGIECHKMILGEPDQSGRQSPKPVKGSEFIIKTDSVIPALGSKPNPLIPGSTNGLEITDRGTINVDEETMATSKIGVYAGGDIVSGSATVILAMGQGKKAANSIDNYIKSKL